MKYSIAITLLSLIFLSACNQNRNNRLSARNHCTPENDIAAYSLSEDEQDIFKEALEFPEDSLHEVHSIKGTVILEGDNEEKVIFSFTMENLNSTEKKPVMKSSCLSGITQATTVEPVSIEIPVGISDGKFISVQADISLGHPTKKDKSDFLNLKAEFKETDIKVEDVIASATEKDIQLIMTPLTLLVSYYNADSDDTTYYTPIELGDGSADPQYILHHKSSKREGALVSLSTRIILVKPKDEKK